MLIFKLVLGIVLQMAVLGTLLFLPAGTFWWWRAWVFLGVWLVVGIVATVALFHGHRDLLNERFKVFHQKGQPLADKIILLLIFADFLGMFVFTPLDVFRFHLLDRPGPFISAAGLVMFVWGFWINFLALRENPFAAPVVKHLEERKQRVIDTGVYAIVRHPMYAGAIPLFIGIPLWLESYAATLLASAIIIILIVRIHLEEELLKRELEGYTAYMERVRYRLIPFLW
jgi:protein-S-isoprenylcysteine O-methyltransferase Ste14